MKQLRECVNALKAGGLTVHMPASHEGVCMSPYCVVQYLGAYPNSGAGTGEQVLRIHLYAPIGQFFLVKELKDRAEAALQPLVESGSLRPCEGVGVCNVNDTFKAHACYLDYRVQYGLKV